jgi:hypothetical protein
MRKVILSALFVSAFIIGTTDASAQCDCIGGKSKTIIGAVATVPLMRSSNILKSYLRVSILR